MSTDLDELIKLLEEEAENRTKVETVTKLDSCDKFIKKLNITRGLDRVPNYVIYYTYQQKYKAGLGETKWSRNHFFQLFNKHFDQARTGRLRTYLLDGKSFDLTRGGLLEAKKYQKEYIIQVKKARGTYKAPTRRYIMRHARWDRKASDDS